MLRLLNAYTHTPNERKINTIDLYRMVQKKREKDLNEMCIVMHVALGDIIENQDK